MFDANSDYVNPSRFTKWIEHINFMEKLFTLSENHDFSFNKRITLIMKQPLIDELKKSKALKFLIPKLKSVKDTYEFNSFLNTLYDIADEERVFLGAFNANNITNNY